MNNWFEIIAIKNIILILIGWFIGRYWGIGKKIIKLINKENEEKQV